MWLPTGEVLHGDDRLEDAAAALARPGMRRARDAYRVRAPPRQPARPPPLAPDRVDQVEVVSVDEGEVVLFWDLTGAHARRVLRLLREDLVALDAEEFWARWAAFEGEDDLGR